VEDPPPIADTDVMAVVAQLVVVNGMVIVEDRFRSNLRILLNHELPGRGVEIEQTIAYLDENPLAVAALAPQPPQPSPSAGQADRPEGVDFPAPSVPGRPPSRLPDAPQRYWDPHPLPPYGAWRDPVLDTPSEQRGDKIETWAARLLVRPPEGWAVSHHLHATAKHLFQLRDDGTSIIADQHLLRMIAIYLDTDSMPSAGVGEPVLSRMRMLHRRSFGAGGWPAVREPEWRSLLDRPAVLDHFGQDGPERWGFSLATDLGDGHGAVVIAGGPPLRADALDVALESASTLELTPGPEGRRLPRWRIGPGWSAGEEVQVSTEEVVAMVRLEAVPPVYAGLVGPAKLDAWEDWVFQTSNPARGARSLGNREVYVDGLDVARLLRFDYQPSGRGRAIVNLVVGLVGEDTGFTFVMESWAGDEAAYIQPDLLLERISVLGPLPGRS
jgi:hypothetical protein